MKGRVVSPPLSSGLCTELCGKPQLKQNEDDSNDQLSHTFQQLRPQGVREGFSFTLGFVLAVVKHRYRLLSDHRGWWFDLLIF